MLQHQPSRTAEYMAMFRASEHAKGAGRRVFADPLAAALLPGSLRLSAKLLAVRPVGEMLTRYIDRQWPGARTSGIARTRLITAGQKVKDRIEVLSGLTAGEKVIFPAPHGLSDGAAVEVRP